MVFFHKHFETFLSSRRQLCGRCIISRFRNALLLTQNLVALAPLFFHSVQLLASRMQCSLLLFRVFHTCAQTLHPTPHTYWHACNACTHIIHTHAHAYTHTHTHTHTLAHAHTPTIVNRHAHIPLTSDISKYHAHETHTCKHPHTPTHTHTHMHASIHICARTHLMMQRQVWAPVPWRQ